MKIEIEFDNSHTARLVIDGKELTVESYPGSTQLVGLDGDIESLGAMIATDISAYVAKIQQAWAAVEDYGTWDWLPDTLAEEVEDQLF